MAESLNVTPVQVAAARLLLKRAKARGTAVDPVVLAIAQARPGRAARTGEFLLGVEDGRTR